ncbi:MCM1 Transcription factor of morphogenesis MCM1 [Candida maltosa Xu316]|uniref:MADS-box domain-containing protein n=1 Tax=Candida maltosa (strain Xu316) TaxID=1245528 RepID=M3JWR4_CANMX|nr:hypothetical protein G210_2300 [Candida maltosa Xu316]
MASIKTEDGTEYDQVQDSQGTNVIGNSQAGAGDDDDDEDGGSSGKTQKERRKIEIKFIQDKSRRHITFSKRKAGIMKKAYELSVLTGTQVLLLVVSETGLVYTFTTPKLQPLVTKAEGKNLIQACLNAPEEGLGDDQENGSDNEANSPEPSPGPNQQQQQQAATQNITAGHSQHIQAQQHQAQQQQQQVQQNQQQIPSGMQGHGLPQHYAQQGNPTGAGGIQAGYGDQYYFGNIPNNNIPNQQQFQ